MEAVMLTIREREQDIETHIRSIMVFATYV